MNNIPESAKYMVVGAGVHGLSAAWHLAMELEARGRGSGQDIVVLDKSGPGAGASWDHGRRPPERSENRLERRRRI